MPNVNPLNGVSFGHEKTREDCLMRAAWEYDQAAKLRAARKPMGYEALVAGHEHTAKDYERLAKHRGSTKAGSASAHARVRTTRDEHVVQGNYGYGHGWEDLTAAETRKEALADLRSYRENELGVPFRLIKRRAKIVAAHAKMRRSHATQSARVPRSDRAAQLLLKYRPWQPRYSNEVFDRYQSLANALTQIDREEHESAFGASPPAGYSKRRYEQAKKVVDEALRTNYAHARKKKLTHLEAKKLLASEGINFARDYHASISMSQGNRIAEVAKLAGYHKRKDAPGSTARMYFQYLARLK